jgi:hypothetical protein
VKAKVKVKAKHKDRQRLNRQRLKRCKRRPSDSPMQSLRQAKVQQRFLDKTLSPIKTSVEDSKLLVN